MKFVKKRYIHFNTTAHDFTTEIPDDPSLNNSILRSKICPKLSKILTQNLIRLSMPNPGTDTYRQSDIYIQTRTVTSILNESSFLKTSITRFTMTWNFTRYSNTNIGVTLLTLNMKRLSIHRVRIELVKISLLILSVKQ